MKRSQSTFLASVLLAAGGCQAPTEQRAQTVTAEEAETTQQASDAVLQACHGTYPNHGQAQKCVQQALNALKAAGQITGSQKGSLSASFAGATGSCIPTTCAIAGDNCGTIPDGCGNTLNCGSCTAPQTCGGGGMANVCGNLGDVLGFASVVTLPVGKYPLGIGVGDFINGNCNPNIIGDCKPDLVTPGSTDKNMSVLLNRRDGTGNFGPATTFDVGFNPYYVAVADFNRDHILDLAVTGSVGVSVLLGTGGGNFGPPTTVALGSDPWVVSVGDFDGDGWPDLAVSNPGANYASVLLNRRDGTFFPTKLTVGYFPIGVAVGDVNGDGRPDLAVANYRDNTVSVLLNLNDGTGNFGPATPIPVGASPVGVTVGDVNGDGRPDIVTADQIDNNVNPLLGNGNYVSVLLGNGDGTFQPVHTFAIGGYGTVGVAVADFNGDGRPDIAAANPITGVSVLLGNGDGTFQPAANFASGGYGPYNLVVADFNGDGKPDLALANTSSVSYLNSVGVLINTSH